MPNLLINILLSICTGFLYTRAYSAVLQDTPPFKIMCQAVIRIFCAVFFLFRLLNSTTTESILMGALLGISVIFTQMLGRP